ncbi:MAG: tetratricopeptide repeat protein [Candidatus Poribacteria bacterium]|nr:tetratricopeptide repeat protein [Candidatus Poribacteria bacterium]
MWVEVYADLAKAYEMLGCWNQALQSLETALRLRPGYPTALRRKKRILEEKKVYDDLIDGMNLAAEAFDAQIPLQHQPAGSAISVVLKIEHKFFTLTCTDAIPQNLRSIVSQLVERAYHEVGEMLQCYPRRRIPISIEVADEIHASQVEDVTRGAGHSTVSAAGTSSSHSSLPLWAAACYDGGIRLTYRAYGDAGIGILYSVIRHEWGHLLVDLLACGRCPRWFDEGLAQLIARPLIGSEQALLQAARQSGQLLSLYEMRKPFSRLPAQQRRFAYLQSRAIVEDSIRQVGLPRIRHFLKQVGAEKPAAIAFQEVFGKTEAEIVGAWSIAE